MIPPDTYLARRYRVEDLLKSGGYGSVMSAMDIKTGEMVAVKLVPLVDRDGTFDESGITEICALKALEGCDVVPKLLCSGRFHTTQFLVLDLFDDDLDDLRTRNILHDFQISTVTQIFWHTIKIVEAIHTRGILHRDIKSNNLMIKMSNGFARLVLVDFGIATCFKDPKTGVRIPTTENRLNFIGCEYSPPRAAMGIGYWETEDLIQVGYMACYLRHYRPWYSPYEDDMVRNKIDFGRHPENYLFEEDRILAPIIKEINYQEPGKDPNYTAILELIEYALNEFNVPKQLNVKTINGWLRLD
ncbi:unnamed protein product [Caenorhabditis brenneri]